MGKKTKVQAEKLFEKFVEEIGTFDKWSSVALEELVKQLEDLKMSLDTELFYRIYKR